MSKVFVGLFDSLARKYVFPISELRKAIITEKSIDRKFDYVKGSKVLYINIPGWRTSFSDSNNLRKRVIKKGFSCLDYHFPKGILSPDARATRKNILETKKVIMKDVIRYKKEYRFRKIAVVGTSLGVVPALLASNGNKDVNKIVLVVPGYNLAEALWTGIATKRLKNKFQKEGINLRKLKKIWGDLNLSDNINKLKGKEIFVYISRADKVIDYSQGKKFLSALKKRYRVKSYINKDLGHYLTCYFAYKYYHFLDD